MKMAKEQGACERPFFSGEPWETKISKVLPNMCCDCCVLGLMTASRASSCELQGLSLERQCTHTAKNCCGINSAEEPKQTDSNECLTGNHNCVSGQVCINTEGSFRCQRETSCGTGYELRNDNDCHDIDECTLGSHNCGPDFMCNNTAGSFRCYPKESCPIGNIQDAVGNCNDLNECVAYASPCLPGETCINTEGSYTCRRDQIPCGRGYHLIEDGMRCEDVDECRTGNVCGVHGCVNLVGTYRCECRNGFIFNSITKLCEGRIVPKISASVKRKNHERCLAEGYPSITCKCVKEASDSEIHRPLCSSDINECRIYPVQLCAHKCENTEGSYKCSCTTGFKLTSDGRSCEDVNECEANPCSQECANVYGSYQCYCRRGYQLSDIDGIACEGNKTNKRVITCHIKYVLLTRFDRFPLSDIDECALPTGGHVCSYRCSNAPGSFYCTCPPTGYTLAHNGRTCQDIDECAAGIHTCSFSESCFNIQGGFRCLSFACPQNFQQAAQGRCERVTCEFTRDPASCFLLPLRISFYNISFPTNTPVPAVVFRMGPSNSVLEDKMLFNIVSGDEEGYFVVQQHAHGGEISLRRTLTLPRDFFLTVEMRLIRYGTAHLYMAKIAVSGGDALINVRCIKSCHPHDISCKINPVHTITHTSLSLPTFRDFHEPEEIVFLRTVTAANSAVPGATDVFFDIQSADDQSLLMWRNAPTRA
ncbi:hypothetical protein F7725_021930 [Dissostichus mawsoni]|uniref:Fibulin-1 n=1 Tax=Dissostichus mawsoni TaxID=36200 RepID=A0A7J5ZEH0_DISMA|nr:hypothetical protein F7725_021930 [Dissostichus mawsoni]